MKKILSLTLAFFFLISLIGVSFADDFINPYTDLSENDWYYECVTNLVKSNILKPTENSFNGDAEETRGNVILYLYNYYKMLGGDFKITTPCKFSDVYESAPYYEAICYATENEIASGVSDDLFDPDAHCTKEQVCTFIIRFAQKNNIVFKKINEPLQFVDSLNISDYARSYVVACKMAGIINGNENNWFVPWQNITKAEAAKITYSLICSGNYQPNGTDELVNLDSKAYDKLYLNYKEIPKPFIARVSLNEPYDSSYFDDCAFVGDSVTLRLQYYCAATKALGNATFLCAGSLSPKNALWEVSNESVHPSFQGVKMTVEDCVLKSGVKKVYIMLGINSISFGVDNCVNDLNTLVNNILSKSPNVKIIIQSVTPMAQTSNIMGNSLNNNKICEYNQKVENLCNENGWHYLDVAEIMKDENGNLNSSYCSDNEGMGIHFTSFAAEKWIDYLKTHIPTYE